MALLNEIEEHPAVSVIGAHRLIRQAAIHDVIVRQRALDA